MSRNIYHTHIKKTFSPLFLHNELIAQFSIVWVTMSCQNVKRLDTPDGCYCYWTTLLHVVLLIALFKSRNRSVWGPVSNRDSRLLHKCDKEGSLCEQVADTLFFPGL